MRAACSMWVCVPSSAAPTKPKPEEDSRELSELCSWNKSSHICLIKGKPCKEECSADKSCKAIFYNLCQTMVETALFGKYYPAKTIGIDDNPQEYNKYTVCHFHHPNSIKFRLSIPTNTSNITINISTPSSDQTTALSNTTNAKKTFFVR